MIKFFNKLKKPCFCPHFPNFFLGGGFFFQKIWLLHTTSNRFLAPCQNLEKTNDAIPRKPPERWKAGQKVRQALFNGILPATAGGQKIELFTRLPENCRNAVDEFFE